jgi:phosphoglycerol transferase MdoB-like AlkP superfamily enzyme
VRKLFRFINPKSKGQPPKPDSHPIVTVVKLYGLALLVFFVFRLILFLGQLDRVSVEQDGLATIFMAFIMGIRFDIVISGYILFFPVLVLFILDVFRVEHKGIQTVLLWVVFTLFSLAFLINAADIPYFNYFFQRFSVSAFEWMDSPLFVLKMVFQEPAYFLVALPAALLILIYFRVLRRIFRANALSNQQVWVKLPLFLVVLGLMFLGIRGRLEKKSPIRMGTAYFSENAFLNQLGLNPVFTLLRSALDSMDESNQVIREMDSEEAIHRVQVDLTIENPVGNSPIAREITADQTASTPNVVVIIMESMSAAKMSRHGNAGKLTPFLDSLSHQSLYFDKVYTAGKHTFNGIFSTLFSFPALYRQHPMKQISSYNGLSWVLKQAGYSTIYFTTHDGQFDNVEGFLMNNDFSRVVSQKDFPHEEVKTALGVPDDYMFRFAIPLLNELAKTKKPFLSVFMTASDHGPYYIPDYFKPTAKDIKEQIVQYADWSLKQFMQQAAKQHWYENTVFVFIADHGALTATPYDLSLDYHHTPLLFFSPSGQFPVETISRMGSQLDVFPTLMGLLNQSYLNNTLGVDLLSENRPYAILNDDDKIGVLDSEYLLIIKPGEASKLYHYTNLDRTNYARNYPDKVKDMEFYARSQMQVFQDMLIRRQTYVEPQSVGR